MSGRSLLVSFPSVINETTCIHSGINNNPNSSDNINHSIHINGSKREYTTLNMRRHNKISINKVLLCFPGGGESINTFISYTQFDQIETPVIIFLGQQSANTYSFQNAFPWLYADDYQNDVLLHFYHIQLHIHSFVFLY